MKALLSVVLLSLCFGSVLTGLGPQPPHPIAATAVPCYQTQTRYAQDVNLAGTYPWAVPWEEPYSIIHAPDGIGASCYAAQEPWITEWICPYDFAFNIPATATILGVRVEARARWVDEGPTALTVCLMQGWDIGTMIPLSLERPYGILSPVWANYGCGGYLDLWDMGITPADINSGMFGAAIRGTFGDNRMGTEIDSVKITVWYSCP